MRMSDNELDIRKALRELDPDGDLVYLYVDEDCGGPAGWSYCVHVCYPGDDPDLTHLWHHIAAIVEDVDYEDMNDPSEPDPDKWICRDGVNEDGEWRTWKDAVAWLCGVVRKALAEAKSARKTRTR